MISIHAPREGGDTACTSRCTCRPYFNPRPPRGGRRAPKDAGRHPGHFNPRPPRGGRPARAKYLQSLSLFQSTPPARGATLSALTCGPSPAYFNPRPPRGGRPLMAELRSRRKHFNPRPPRGGRRPHLKQIVPQTHISIHAPREGGDANHDTTLVLGRTFQSTPPARGATRPTWRLLLRPNRISIHAPREGGDSKNSQNFKLLLQQSHNSYKYFIRTPAIFQKQGHLFTENTANSGAKPRKFPVRLRFAPKASRRPPGHKTPLLQNAQPCFHSGCPSSKSAGYPFPDP